MKLKDSKYSYLSAKCLILESYFPKVENLKSYLSLSKDVFIDHVKKSYNIETDSQDLVEILNVDWYNTIKSFKRLTFDERLYRYFEIEKKFEEEKSDLDLFEKEYEKLNQEKFLLKFSDFFKRFIMLKIDMFNIFSFLKHKHFEFPFKFIKGGSFNERVFRSFEKETIYEFIGFINLKYPKLIEKPTDQFFEFFDKRRDDYLISYLKRSKYITFGPEIIFSFLILKSFNNINLKLIYNGIIYNIPHENVSRRLRIING